MIPEPEEREAEETTEERVGAFIGRLLVIPVLVAIVYAVLDAIFTASPAPADPDFIDRLFASDSVLAAVRVAIIAAAAYLIISIFALSARSQWLTRIGPVQVSEPVSDVVRENESLRNSLEDAEETIEDLRDELADTNDLLELALDTIATATDQKDEDDQ